MSAFRERVLPCIRVQLENFSNPNLLKTSIVARCPLGWSKTYSVFAEPSIKHAMQPGALATSASQETSTAALVGNEKIGVLLLNLGGQETLDDVQPFLFNLFADPDIIRLPRLFCFLQKPLGQFISVARSPKSREGYASIGGGSPLHRITDAQIKRDGNVKLVVLPLYPQFSISTSGSSLRLLESIFREDEYI
ncbi:hypothetical protein OROMI_024084 [Orobanche minor]